MLDYLTNWSFKDTIRQWKENFARILGVSPWVDGYTFQHTQSFNGSPDLNTETLKLIAVAEETIRRLDQLDQRIASIEMRLNSVEQRPPFTIIQKPKTDA